MDAEMRMGMRNTILRMKADLVLSLETSIDWKVKYAVGEPPILCLSQHARFRSAWHDSVGDNSMVKRSGSLGVLIKKTQLVSATALVYCMIVKSSPTIMTLSEQLNRVSVLDYSPQSCRIEMAQFEPQHVAPDTYDTSNTSWESSEKPQLWSRSDGYFFAEQAKICHLLVIALCAERLRLQSLLVPGKPRLVC